MILIFIVIVSIFLAFNMGASGFSISFAPSYGSGIVKRKFAVLLYTIFVLIGAVIFGNRVVETLTKKLLINFSNQYSGLIIILSSSFTMFIANFLKIPQSTSFIIVGTLTGAGIYYGKTNFLKLIEIIIYAILFSFISFITTYYLMRYFYPPREKNLRIYEKIYSKIQYIRNFILYTDCYSAFAVGTNNVANVVAPLMITGINITPTILLFIFAPFFGIGGLIFGKGVINTISKEIIPLGEISAGIISFVTASFVIIASILGLPTPYVQFTTFSILGISAIKDTISLTIKKDLVKKIFFCWILLPILSGLICFILHFISLK